VRESILVDVQPRRLATKNMSICSFHGQVTPTNGPDVGFIPRDNMYMMVFRVFVPPAFKVDQVGKLVFHKDGRLCCGFRYSRGLV